LRKICAKIRSCARCAHGIINMDLVIDLANKIKKGSLYTVTRGLRMCLPSWTSYALRSNEIRTHLNNTPSPRCVEFSRSARRDEETVARVTAPRSNDALRENNRNPKGPVRLPQSPCRRELTVSLRIRFRSCSLALRQSDGVADGGIVEMGSLQRIGASRFFDSLRRSVHCRILILMFLRI
jgi:hypothetical protein